jgi:hypothetical protein
MGSVKLSARDVTLAVAQAISNAEYAEEEEVAERKVRFTIKIIEDTEIGNKRV